MCQLYQITNSLPSSKNFPLIRQWVLNNQCIQIGRGLIKLTIKPATKINEFNILIIANKFQTTKVTHTLVKPHEFYDMTNDGYFIAIRAFEWSDQLIPRRLLVEFIALDQRAKLSIRK